MCINVYIYIHIYLYVKHLYKQSNMFGYAYNTYILCRGLGVLLWRSRFVDK